MKRLTGIFIAAFIAVGAAGPTAGALPDAAAPPEQAYLSGQLLVASPSMKSGVFARSVILVFRHDAGGAFGVIINRPQEKHSIGELMRRFGIEGEATRPEREITVHFGGPVSRHVAMVVHSNDFSHPNSVRITSFASATASHDYLRAVAEGKQPNHSLFAVGYAGWGPGQLEREMKEGSWVVAAPDSSFVFDGSYSTMWKRALNRRFLDL